MLKRGFQFAPGYRLQEFLGRGQFGQVWRATAPGGAAAAVKFIDLTDGQGQKEYDGVRRVKQIRHANLMPITAIWLLDAQGQVIDEAPDEANETIDISVAEARGQSALFGPTAVDPSWLVVAMLLGGKSLQQRLRECVDEGLPGIPPRELISYMDESAKGLDFLNAPQHDLGEGPIAIQHCDVKPANIVLIGSSAVVCDFGLARILTRNQVTATSAAGTPAYMAPEAITGKPSRTSDQYSLAVTYYHLRTGTLPVNDGSLWEVLDAHRMGKLKLGLVPEAEQHVLRKATNLNWEKRFESNVDLVDALREALRAAGHTKPSFVPPGANLSGAAAAGAVVNTVDLAGDPTATVDLASAPAGATSGQSAVNTVPFVQADHPTSPGFADETMPALQDSPPPLADSLPQRIRRSPKLIVGVTAGVAALVILMAVIASRPDQPVGGDQGGDDEQQQQIDDSDDDQKIVVADAATLVSQALQLFTSDEQAAGKKLLAALAADPSIASLDPQRLVGHKGTVMQMVVTPDGRQLISIADDDAAFVWPLDRADANPTKLTGHQNLVTAIALAPDGQRLLTAGMDRNPRIWDLKSKQVQQSALTLDGHIDEVKAMLWHPDPAANIVVTAAADQKIGLWQIGRANADNPHGTVQAKRLVPIGRTIGALSIDPQATWLAAIARGDDLVSDQVEVLAYPWPALHNTLQEPASPSPLVINAATAKRIVFAATPIDSHTSMLVVGGFGGDVSVYALPEPSQTNISAELIDQERKAHMADVEAMRIVGTDRHNVIVTGSADGSVHWWQMGASDQRQKLQLSEMTISSVDVSADGRWVAAGGYDGTVWLWDTAGSKSELAVQLVVGSSINSVLIDPSGQWLLAAADDGAIRKWPLPMAKLLAHVSPTPTAPPIDGPTKTIELRNQVTKR